VEKHLRHAHRRPIAEHTRAAFDAVRSRVEGRSGRLIFDSFCGTGMSTALLAQRYPDSVVLGIDKSGKRLRRHAKTPAANYLLVRAECGDFWRLAAAAGWRVQHHFLLYPNPWPKPGQLQRRIHGSPDFAALLALGGTVELRSNWPIYVEEFGCALVTAGQFPVVDRVQPAVAMTLHERKYFGSGHPLWRCRCHLRDNTGPLSPAGQAR
jgi:tRNA G46 methylase TrmB